jgi:hypothetical protein
MAIIPGMEIAPAMTEKIQEMQLEILPEMPVMQLEGVNEIATPTITPAKIPVMLDIATETMIPEELPVYEMPVIQLEGVF